MGKTQKSTVFLQVETFRATNIWGTLTWQLNDVYPSGSWGSLEYGPEGRAGQVVGGRWKVLHYVLRQTVSNASSLLRYHFMLIESKMPSFYQDRLGTNIGKALTKERCVFLRPLLTSSQPARSTARATLRTMRPPRGQGR